MKQKLNYYKDDNKAILACHRLNKDPYVLMAHEVKRPSYKIKRDIKGAYIEGTYYPMTSREFERRKTRNKTRNEKT